MSSNTRPPILWACSSPFLMRCSTLRTESFRYWAVSFLVSQFVYELIMWISFGFHKDVVNHNCLSSSYPLTTRWQPTVINNSWNPLPVYFTEGLRFIDRVRPILQDMPFSNWKKQKLSFKIHLEIKFYSNAIQAHQHIIKSYISESYEPNTTFSVANPLPQKNHHKRQKSIFKNTFVFLKIQNWTLGNKVRNLLQQSVLGGFSVDKLLR